MKKHYCIIISWELLAVVHFSKQYLLQTDHTALRSFKEPKGQLGRWLETLESLDYD